MIIPRPSDLTELPGRFVIGPALHLEAGPGTRPAADLLADYLGADRPRTTTGPVVRLHLAPELMLSLGPEGYRLEIRPRRVELTAPAPQGLLNGVQTLRQLLPPAALDPATAPADAWWWPCVSIRDRPRLAWRGLLLDVARHFMPLDYLYRTVDRLALHKLNVLHLHLTDDQGWRVEIDGWPRLTEVGAWRTGPTADGGPGGPYGGYYTARELRDLVDHAAARGVTVVPEIEMPGHVRAALAAYPQLGNRPRQQLPVWDRWGISEDILAVDDHVLDFCRQVLDATAEIFPSRHLHIGGDECPTTAWETNPGARRRAAALGLGGVRGLHAWFLTQMHDHLAARGRRAMSWDETGHSPGRLPAGVALTAWRDPAHGAAAVARGHQVVMAPHTATYLDYPQSGDPDEPAGQPGGTVTLETVHAFDALAGGLTATEPGSRSPGVLGVQAQLWTEYAATPAHADYLAYPRLCALAENAWSGRRTGFAEFLTRLHPHRERLRALGVASARLPTATH
ncbi:beta-N-acetylhexosaminidase [Streptacidiphilus jiangxiensis]|uniref:beta-N-acetylhexosaminidase n=1 Tax=Streptacidiphilus jiangxiensis TaxID=235985 RepID=A0A1H7U8N4_STRJI|nr:beta-N-acetylhexosaminidase [Streptacidiphilus jiangxiensis]SEL93075.1 hexosaminidase [Streptacidiphilus jiangxiensis]